jgi:hypothetical protein
MLMIMLLSGKRMCQAASACAERQAHLPGGGSHCRQGFIATPQVPLGIYHIAQNMSGSKGSSIPALEAIG